MYTAERLVSIRYDGSRRVPGKGGKRDDVPLAVTRESAAHQAVPGMATAWASCVEGQLSHDE